MIFYYMSSIDNIKKPGEKEEMLDALFKGADVKIDELTDDVLSRMDPAQLRKELDFLNQAYDTLEEEGQTMEVMNDEVAQVEFHEMTARVGNKALEVEAWLNQGDSKRDELESKKQGEQDKEKKRLQKEDLEKRMSLARDERDILRARHDLNLISDADYKASMDRIESQMDALLEEKAA